MAVAAEADVQREIGETVAVAGQFLQRGGKAQPGEVLVQRVRVAARKARQRRKGETPSDRASPSSVTRRETRRRDRHLHVRRQRRRPPRRRPAQRLRLLLGAELKQAQCDLLDQGPDRPREPPRAA